MGGMLALKNMDLCVSIFRSTGQSMAFDTVLKNIRNMSTLQTNGNKDKWCTIEDIIEKEHITWKIHLIYFDIFVYFY